MLKPYGARSKGDAISVAETRGALPPAVEAAWVARAETLTGSTGHEALEKLRPAVAHLSDLFTLERPSQAFPDYLADPTLLTAYGLFFFPQSWTRTYWALAHAQFRGWQPRNQSPRVLDVGSGPGSCGLAVAHGLGTAGDLHLLDHSTAAMAAGQALGGAAAPGWNVHTHKGNVRDPRSWPEGSFDVLVAGFVLNELALKPDDLEAWFESAAARLAPGGLLMLIEPALRLTAEPLRRLADRRATLSPARIGPEVDNQPCPMLGSEHWDHEVRDWTPPSATEFLNRKLHRNLSAVRFSLALFSDAPLPPLAPHAARIVAEPQLLKGLIRLIVRTEGQLRTLELPTRGLNKHDAKALVAKFARGDILAVPPSEGRRVEAGHLTHLGP